MSVMTYNVLARCNADSMHARSHASALTWSFRRKRLLDEIASRDCDLICLQDIDDYDFWRRDSGQEQGAWMGFHLGVV